MQSILQRAHSLAHFHCGPCRSAVEVATGVQTEQRNATMATGLPCSKIRCLTPRRHPCVTFHDARTALLQLAAPGTAAGCQGRHTSDLTAEETPRLLYDQSRTIVTGAGLLSRQQNNARLPAASRFQQKAQYADRRRRPLSAGAAERGYRYPPWLVHPEPASSVGQHVFPDFPAERPHNQWSVTSFSRRALSSVDRTRAQRVSDISSRKPRRR